MLDIVITHYKEPWDVCRGLFETLDAQRGVNWDEISVTVINDGGEFIPAWYLFGFEYYVDQISIRHSGVSAARNAGLDRTDEPWIMFCDCDDTFANVFALQDIMNVLHSPNRDNFDMMAEVGEV